MSDKLKIAFFCWESLYSEKVGGLAPATTQLAEELAKDHEIHFFTRGAEDEIINGVHYHYYQPYGENIVEYCGDLSVNIFKRFKEFDGGKFKEFDILHFHDWHFIEALHLLKNRRTILSFHSTEYGRNGSSFGGWYDFKEISGKEWYGAYIAKKIITVSENTKKEVAWLYNVPEWKLSVIENGVYPNEFKLNIDPGEIKQKYGIPPLVPVILFIGRIVHQKGVDILLDSIPHILKHRSDVQFLIMGDGDMRYGLEEKAKQEKLPVKFLGKLPDQECKEVLNACDIMVMPSRNEPFGIVLLEAWSAKKCVVATDIGGLSENIENFVDGIKVFVNPESIAWGVNHIINDAEQVKALGLAGYKKVHEKYDWKLIKDKTVKLYKEMIKSDDRQDILKKPQKHKTPSQKNMRGRLKKEVKQKTQQMKKHEKIKIPSILFV